MSSNTTSDLSIDQINQIVAYVNKFRALNQAPPMNYNNSISSFSKQWSNYLLTNNLFQHSGTQLYGENLAYFQGYGTDIVTLIKMSIDAWYNEISAYDFKNPGFSEATGHFTCLVWISSTDFGIGISIDNKTQKAIISMNTSPPGNVIGKFQQNVLPTISEPVPSPVPSPVPTTQNYQIVQIITYLNNIIYWVKIRKPANFLILQISNVINMLLSTNYPNVNNITYSLKMVTFYIQTRHPTAYVVKLLNNIISQISVYV